ncbi:uncharacterized protein LOC125039975 [Penaeus chinensis]|uniref:uncharacterized protein LOC125039975 n=1 Tax=Penaeus chinensis TaxID=139456 RepID=UPI001FB6ABF1|nr:uncharacterized protein LOC125039975 [Penaeus chinensis]
MKLFEKGLDARIRKGTGVSEQQFRFMPIKGTTDATFLLRQLIETYAEKPKDLHFAYDRVPRQKVWRPMREKGFAEKYVRLVKYTHRDVTTQVRNSVGTAEKISVGFHQGSALSPYFCYLIMDVLANEVKEDVPWSMLFAKDIVLKSSGSTPGRRREETGKTKNQL